MTSAAFDDVVRGRASCRAFLPDAVPVEVLTEVFELAQRAPSWCNTQPWHVTLSDDPAQTARFASALLDEVQSGTGACAPDIDVPAGYAGDHAARRRECGLMLYDQVGIARDDRPARTRQAMENFRFFGAPHVAIVTVDKALGPYALVDVGIYLGHLVLAARSRDLGTIVQGAIAHYSGFIRRWFEIPDDEAVLVGVALGRPADDAVNDLRIPRAAVADVVRRR